MKKSVIFLLLGMAFQVQGRNTCTSGIAQAVPVKDGVEPVIDGKLEDWDLSGRESAWIKDDLADQQYCTIAFMYNDAALFVSAEMALYTHELTNENRPGDRYWQGDLIQLRLSTDRSLPYPLPSTAHDQNPKRKPIYRKNNQVTCVNFWRNTLTGKDQLYITPGALFDCEKSLLPAGSAIKIIQGKRSYVMEARVPWTALGVKDGKNPFRPGELMPAVVDIKWAPGSDGYFTTMIYRKDPGAFAFSRVDTWGQIRLSPTGNLEPHAQTLTEIAREAGESSSRSARVGMTPIRLRIPKDGYLSVNILDEKGSPITEVMGGEFHRKGEVLAYWNGRDAFGYPLPTGKRYRWGAYLNDGVDVQYFGTVGTSGEPPYETRNRKGAWGGDHGAVTACYADESGRYFVWYGNESGRAFVKTDLKGKLIWRTSPFVCGGFGSYTAMTRLGKFLYVVADSPERQHLIRISCRTGNYEYFANGKSDIPLGKKRLPFTLPPRSSLGEKMAFQHAGIATDGERLYLSDSGRSCIRILNPDDGAELGSLPVRLPRGCTFHGGRLFVASAEGKILSCPPKGGAWRVEIDRKLEAPYSLILSDRGRMYVADLGKSQQIKVFEAGPQGWKFLHAWGKPGGRTLLGRLDPESFLYPGGLGLDPTGVLLVPEISSPKIISLLDAATGKFLRKYYGYTAYSPSNIPDCDDPLTQYYSLSGPTSFAKATIPAQGGIGVPTAVWDFVGSGITEFGPIFSTMTLGQVLRASNGMKYLVPDGQTGGRRPRTICRIAEGDRIIPVASVDALLDKRSRKTGVPLRFWLDANGDGRIQECETRTFPQLCGLAHEWAPMNGSMGLDAEGNLSLVTQNNRIVLVPSAGWTPDGVPQWEPERARIAIPEIIPGLKKLHCTWRTGMTGQRRDSKGNWYTMVSYNPDYATPALTKQMQDGMGHTSSFRAVKFVKYAPDGKLLWMTGRKAISTPRQGEILHHWTIAGLIGDEYVVSASEWGPFWIYTKDGFYAGQLFDTPGDPKARPIPYLFGGENFSGQIRYFPKRNEVWAYNAGHTFRVSGFDHGRIRGECRLEGSVALKEVAPLGKGGERAEDLSSEKTISFPENLASVRLTKTEKNLELNFRVKDPTPLENVALSVDQIFKGGDAVGIELGEILSTPPKEVPERNPGTKRYGYTRILAAPLEGRPVVVGMKVHTGGMKRMQRYFTPSGGTSAYEFVGEVPGAKVSFEKTPDGYTATLSIPWGFFEFDAKKGCAAEAEVLFSGQGGRGVGTLRRLYLYSPRSSATSMTDDTPTESRMYPRGWGRLQ